MTTATKNIKLKEVKTIDTLKITRVKSNFERVKITSSRTANEVLRLFVDLDTIDYVESSHILTLDRQNMVTGYKLLGVGGDCSCVMDIKVIAQTALLSGASGIILAHNHPSGNINPSNEDIKITSQAKAALKLINIELLDHIILTDTTYCSLSDEGKLNY